MIGFQSSIYWEWTRLKCVTVTWFIGSGYWVAMFADPVLCLFSWQRSLSCPKFFTCTCHVPHGFKYSFLCLSCVLNVVAVLQIQNQIGLDVISLLSSHQITLNEVSDESKHSFRLPFNFARLNLCYPQEICIKLLLQYNTEKEIFVLQMSSCQDSIATSAQKQQSYP